MFSQQNEDKTLKILMTNTHKPTIEGHIRSPVLPLIRGYNFLNKMKECALRTEHIRSQPPLLCETKPNQTSNTDAVALEMFADSDMYETNQEASYAKNRLQMCAFARQKNMAAALNGKRPKDEDVEIDEYTGRVKKKQKQKEIWEESVFVLPEGMTMSRPLHADARSDLVQLIDKHNDLVCSVMGVPKTLLLDIDEAGGGMGGTSGGTMDLTYRLYMRAIESLAMKLKPYMEEVYFEVYGETADVNFPFLPMIDTDELIKLGELGIISRKTLGRHLLAAVGLPAEEMDLQNEAAVKTMTRPEHQKTEPAQPAKKPSKG